METYHTSRNIRVLRLFEHHERAWCSRALHEQKRSWIRTGKPDIIGSQTPHSHPAPSFSSPIFISREAGSLTRSHLRLHWNVVQTRPSIGHTICHARLGRLVSWDNRKCR